tara:strand:- start:1321 stop:1557 length:237 start_codon:yes stop_codon:yes gene_type:complete
MKVKILKSKVNIELTHREYHNMISKVNDLDDICSTASEMNDIYLSDLRRLYSIKWDLRELVDARWDGDTYRYVARQDD